MAEDYLSELLCLWGLKESEGRPKVNYVTVFERPGLHEFLKKIREFADLVLFTAGLEGFACFPSKYQLC